MDSTLFQVICRLELTVDPMKRITISDILQHQWFKIHLLRYLAVPPPDGMQHPVKLDEEILPQVTRMGFDRDQLLASLQKRIQDDATVAYYLLYNNHLSLASTGYLAAEFRESMDAYSPGLFPNLDLQLSTRNGIPQEASLRQPYCKEKKWQVGLQLYKTQDEKYLLDLQRISGPEFPLRGFLCFFHYAAVRPTMIRKGENVCSNEKFLLYISM